MPHTTYRRIDLTIALSQGEHGGVQVDAAPRDVSHLAGFAAFDPGRTVASGKLRGAVRDAARAWARAVESEGGDDAVLPRVVLRIESRALHDQPWETLVGKMMGLKDAPDYTVVRQCLVPARDAALAWTLPLRIVHVDAAGTSAVRRAVDERFGAFYGEQAGHAVRVREIGPDDLAGWRPAEEWPTAEVIHMGALAEVEPEARLSVAQPERPGTLGWLTRFTDAAQTRLLVLESGAGVDDGELRRLAAGLVERGGPAVLVLPAGPDALTTLYDLLIHDRPLDWITRALRAHGRAALFAGAGREEAIRVSGPGARIAEIADRLKAGGEKARAVLAELGVALAQAESLAVEREAAGPADPRARLDELSGAVEKMGDDWPGYTFERHEGGGLIPYARELAHVRDAVLGSIEAVIRHTGIAGYGRPGSGGGSFRVPRPSGSSGPTGSAGGPFGGAGRWGGAAGSSGGGGRYDWQEVDAGEMARESGGGSSGGSYGGGLGGRTGRSDDADAVERGGGDWLGGDDGAPQPQSAGPTGTSAAERSEPPSRSEWLESAATSDPAGSPEPVDEGEAAGGERDERWVNPSLWAPDGAGASEPVPQAGARLVVGRVYHLGIGVGRRDTRVRVESAMPFLEEVLKLRPEDEGTWVEIAVTGIGFDVLGSPVQELWLPRGADTETLRFAVVPRDRGVAVLRYIVYHRNNVVQTFRLAALTGDEGAVDDPGGPALLARALDLEPGSLRGEGWLARLEFSVVSGTEGIASRPARDLSIVANDLGGRPVVTVKSAGDYDVRFPGNMAPEVQRLRALLDSLATEPSDAGALYRFGRADPARPNAGDDEGLKAALVTLAHAGWNLYTQLLNGEMRAALGPLLEQDGQRTIKVAHVLIEKVIPWSLVYDRPFSRNAAAGGDGVVPAVDACLAALPAADGTPSPVVCGGPGCLLSGEVREQRLRDGLPPFTAGSVACPRRFWGFRHVVEVSPKPVPAGGTPVAEVDAVLSGTPARLMAAFNGSLLLARPHLGRLEEIDDLLPGAAWGAEFAGPMVRRKLLQPDLDLIYLYCHARGGAGDPGGMPRLEFVDDAQAPVVVEPADLVDDGAWAHHPLVILNGCGTVGFSPDALSPFIPILVDDRGAAGLLGTEISVWEQLATEFAEHFIRAFLSGRTAGAALLEARRILLAQRNPLGLAYTLYANSDLRFSPVQPATAAEAAAAVVSAGGPAAGGG